MMVRTLLACMFCAGPALAEELVGLRPLVVAQDAVLRLGDLFEGAGARAAAPIGAAPAPGRRLVLEAPQLLAIARANGLAWRPLSVQDRAVVESPGQAIPREEVEAALRGDLARFDVDPDAELDLGAVTLPMVPPGAGLRLATEATSFDQAAGRFATTLVVMADGTPTQRLRITGRAFPTATVVVATRRLALGEVVAPGDARLVRLRADRVRPGAADRLDQVVGQQLRRPVSTGLPLQRGDLGAPSLVEKNALVTMLLEAPGLSLSAQGRALDAAPRGGLVPVMNLLSRTVVEGQVIGPGRVRIAMGAAPLREMP